MKELKEIKLFKRLEKLDKDFASQLKKTANKIKELINKKTTINFPNYTNHDMNHSFKLMDTMHELIKDNKKDFNALEIALMIYSCLFHDIGMAISDKDIEKIKDNTSKYLYGQDFNEVIKNNFDNEDLALQEIIRISHGKIAYDLITSKYEEEFRLPEYENISFRENLAEICLSHTVDKSYVEGLETTTIKGKYEYNTQFLSILLRLADILDIDSTRTPLALYEAMDLNDFSDGEWQKNFTIDNIKKIFKSNDLKEIKLEGTCKDIKIHRKLLSYIKWIENELRLAVDLTANMDKKYHIKLNTEVKNKIKPIGYTIPDLKLNIDYQAVTNLLMGEAIYGSKDLGLRELLQNSIDAIMVKKDKLEMENHPSKDSYEPTINIDIDKENNKVIISDNGMGMNEYIIKNYFLNVGKSYYKSKDFLNYKHSYNPIGNFGIGFLSCFMLSNEVQVITKHFNSNKIYTIDLEKNCEYIAFKEEEDNNYESGTQIILNLKSFSEKLKKSKNILEDIRNLINKNIYIEKFKIKINNTQIEEKNTTIKSEYSINLENYTNNITGKILIDIIESVNRIKYDIKYSQYTYYFDGKEFNLIKNFDELDLNNLVLNNEINYCKIPYTDLEEANRIDEILDASSFDMRYTIENKFCDKYICLFTSKDFYFSRIHDNLIYLDMPIINSSDENNFPLYLNDIKSYISILNDKYITPILYENTSLLFNNRIIFLSRYETYIVTDGQLNKNCIYIKNIATGCKIDIKKFSNIKINNIRINIKDTKMLPSISRKVLLEDSTNVLNNAIGKIVHLFILENIELTKYKKELIQKLIKEYYSEDNFLLKDTYNNYNLD